MVLRCPESRGVDMTRQQRPDVSQVVAALTSSDLISRAMQAGIRAQFAIGRKRARRAAAAVGLSEAAAGLQGWPWSSPDPVVDLSKFSEADIQLLMKSRNVSRSELELHWPENLIRATLNDIRRTGSQVPNYAKTWTPLPPPEEAAKDAFVETAGKKVGEFFEWGKEVVETPFEWLAKLKKYAPWAIGGVVLLVALPYIKAARAPGKALLARSKKA